MYPVASAFDVGVSKVPGRLAKVCPGVRVKTVTVVPSIASPDAACVMENAARGGVATYVATLTYRKWQAQKQRNVNS